MRKIHKIKEAPQPVGPYSQAVEVDGWVYCSGQISQDAKSGELITGDIKTQTQTVMQNIDAVLKGADLKFSDIVKTTIFLADMNDFADMNSVYAEYFPENPPARSCVAVKTLPKNVSVEIEVLARRS